MATRALQPVRWIKGRDGKTPEMQKLTGVTAINPGELLVKANEVLAICADAATVVTHLAVTDSDDQVLPGDSAYTMPVVIVRPGDTFEMSAWSVTPASAVIADSALDAQAGYNIKKVTVSGVTAWVLDIDVTGGSAPCVRLIGRSTKDSATDLYPRVSVQFLNTVTQATS